MTAHPHPVQKGVTPTQWGVGGNAPSRADARVGLLHQQ